MRETDKKDGWNTGVNGSEVILLPINESRETHKSHFYSFLIEFSYFKQVTYSSYLSFHLGVVKEVVKKEGRETRFFQILRCTWSSLLQVIFSQQVMAGFHKVTPLPPSVYHSLPTYVLSTSGPSQTVFMVFFFL